MTRDPSIQVYAIQKWTARRDPLLLRSENVPFKSKAQRRKFAELLVAGEISADTFEEWNRETGRKSLPERVTRKTTRKAPKRKAAKKR
jgi:hypothetical protein